MSMIYHRPVNPQNKCLNCKYYLKTMGYCMFVEHCVDKDSLCPEYARR